MKPQLAHIVLFSCLIFPLVYLRSPGQPGTVIVEGKTTGLKDGDTMMEEALSCGVECEENPHCLGTDIPCPGCDELGSNTCSDVTSREYNPGGSYIQWAVTRFHDTCIPYKAVPGGTVVCCRTQSCGEGSWIIFQMCSTGTACTGAFPLPMGCQTCTLIGTPTNVPITNCDCVYDKCCCPDPHDPDDAECFPH